MCAHWWDSAFFLFSFFLSVFFIFFLKAPKRGGLKKAAPTQCGACLLLRKPPSEIKPLHNPVFHHFCPFGKNVGLWAKYVQRRVKEKLIFHQCQTNSPLLHHGFGLNPYPTLSGLRPLLSRKADRSLGRGVRHRRPSPDRWTGPRGPAPGRRSPPRSPSRGPGPPAG